MALTVSTTFLGLPVPEAYARIGGLLFNGGIGPREELSITFRIDVFASKQTYLDGQIGAFKSEEVSVTFPAGVGESIDDHLAEMCGNYDAEQLKILAFALVRRLGYLAVKQLPEFQEAADA